MFQSTVGDLAVRLGVEYPAATAIVKLMLLKGFAKEVGKRPTAKGKGKPATIYELQESFTLNLIEPAQTVETVPAAETQNVPDEFERSQGVLSEVA
jgi:hypothetical protein